MSRAATLITAALVLLAVRVHDRGSADARREPDDDGDPAVDAVLERLDSRRRRRRSPPATTCSPSSATLSTTATVAQAGPARRSVTIGIGALPHRRRDERHVRPRRRRRARDTIDAARVSDTQLTPDFYASSAAARLRRDAGARVDATSGSTTTIAGEAADVRDDPGHRRLVDLLRPRQRTARPPRRRRRHHRHDQLHPRRRRDAASSAPADAGQTDTSAWSLALSGSGPASVATTMSSRRMPHRPGR